MWRIIRYGCSSLKPTVVLWKNKIPAEIYMKRLCIQEETFANAKPSTSGTMLGRNHMCIASRSTKTYYGQTFLLPAETVKNHETRPNHERIASANDQSESDEGSRLKGI